MMQNHFILTAAQRTQAMSLDADGECEIDPRAVDNASPGVGLNLNDNAVGYAPGAPVTLTGTYVAPKHIVDDAQYKLYCPALLTYLLTLPWASLESETIFAPVEN